MTSIFFFFFFFFDKKCLSPTCWGIGFLVGYRQTPPPGSSGFSPLRPLVSWALRGVPHCAGAFLFFFVGRGLG